VTRSGRPAAGYTVTDEKGTTLMCGPQSEASFVAVNDNIVFCPPSVAYAVVCWKDPAPSTAICFPDPWSKKLVRMPSEGSLPTVTAPSKAQPFGLLLSNGDRCKIRDGGAFSQLEGHPDLYVGYFCTSGKVLWGKQGSSGISRSTPTWTVQAAPESGSVPLKTLRVVKAYFIGTQGG
jgi:hypothetical protein